jgi:ATP-binding cassette subfamily B protein
LARLPENQRARIVEEGAKKFAVLGDKMIIQAAAGPIKAEYRPWA